MRSFTDMWVVNTRLYLMLHHTEDRKFHLEQNQLKSIAALQLPLLSQPGAVLGIKSIPYPFKPV